MTCEQECALAVSAIKARLDAMDRATELMHDDYSRVPTELDRRASQLEQLISEKVEMVQRQHDTLQKFADTRDRAIDRAAQEVRTYLTERLHAIDMRFAERDLRFSQTAIDHQTAIAAALSAVQTATDKNERTFNKQLEGLSASTQASMLSVSLRMDDLKERFARREGSFTGMSAVTGWIVAAITSVTAIVATMVAIYNVTRFVPHL